MNTEISELEYWLALARAPRVGSVKFGQLLQRFGSPQAVFTAAPQEWINFGLKPALIEYLQHPDWQAVHRDIAWLQGVNNHLIPLTHPHYPTYLRHIPAPPPLLFVHGNVQLLSQIPLAMVGTRHPSVEGAHIARQFAAGLAQAGFTVVSGLALGIDAASHQGALAATGRTIAVAGTGLDQVYPAQHLELAHQISEKGALVSEFPPGTSPIAANFPQRNRIISGLSLGTVVIEASTKSGSLITARYAIEQGREVFAVPGALSNPQSRGCHMLIKDGAKLVESPEDIIEELRLHLPLMPTLEIPVISSTPPTVPTPAPPITAALPLFEPDMEYSALLKYMGTTATSIDKLVDASGLTAEAISSMLLILELQGVVKSQSGGLYIRVK